MHINWSKTIQFGEREVISPLLTLKESKLCPLNAYELMMSLKCRRPNDVFFTLNDGSSISEKVT